MGILLDLLVNLFGELFLNDSAERIDRKRIERRIKRLIRHYEWFDQLYRVEAYRQVIEQDEHIHTQLLDKKYVRQLDLNLAERDAFERLLAEKASRQHT